MYCKHCGYDVDEGTKFCPSCGARVSAGRSSYSGGYSTEGSAVGWGILSWLIPLVGIILFFSWKHERPRTSKVCGICALVSIVLYVAMIVGSFALVWYINRFGGVIAPFFL